MADIERRFRVDPDGRDIVEFSLLLDDSSADALKTFQPFSLEYLAITDLDRRRVAATPKGSKPPKPTSWNPQTDFDWQIAGGMTPATTHGVAASPTPQRLIAWGEQRYFVGQIRATFRWVDNNGVDGSKSGEFPAGNTTNAQQTVQLSEVPPSLASILQTAKPTAVETKNTTDLAEQAAAILNVISKRLERGLGDAWLNGNAPSKNGLSYLDVPLADVTTEEELEECWAQHLSQFLVGSNYAGPGQTFGLGGTPGDVKLYRKFADIDDPACAPVFACQHLCTMAYISRGLDEAAVRPLDARSVSPVATYRIGAQSTGSIVSPNSPAGDNRTGAIAHANGILVPGLCYVVDGIAHVAFVLRALKSGRMQLIDTGAMLCAPGHSSPLVPNGGFNYDTSPQTAVTRRILHMGVPPRAGALRSAIERMRRTRPLTLGRLLLLRRNSSRDKMQERLLYASPLMPLWSASDPRRNYHIPLLCWSLRELPYLDRIEARWLVDVPCRAPLREGVLASRNFSFTGVANPRDPLRLERLSIADITSTSTGGVQWIESFVQDMTGAAFWRHEGGTSTNAWSHSRRDSYLDLLPIGPFYAASASGAGTYVLPSPDNIGKLPKPNQKDNWLGTGCPNRVELSAELFATIPSYFRELP